MTQFQVSHEDGRYRVYATEFGVDRRYFREMFENPRAAIAFSDSPMTTSPEYESRSREGGAVFEVPAEMSGDASTPDDDGSTPGSSSSGIQPAGVAESAGSAVTTRGLFFDT